MDECKSLSFNDNRDDARVDRHLSRQNRPGAQTEAQPVKRRPGRPPIENPRQAVSLRLEPDVLEKFRATGPGWQRRINDVLKAAKL